MGTDGNYRIDLGEVVRNIQTAEVICLHFPLLRRTVIVDTRHGVEDPPLIKLVAVAKSVEDRFRTIRRLRPQFQQPEKVTIIPWPMYIESLVRLGVWDEVLKRFAGSGHLDSLPACERVLMKLRAMESAELAAAITGASKQYDTIWERSKR